MRKILVTGGCGYIGSHTTIELLNNGYEVVIFDNLEIGERETVARIKEITGKSVDLIEGDLRGLEDIRGALDSSFSAVIHFAAYKNVVDSVSDPLKYYENNVIGTYNLVKAMAENGVSKMVFSSSSAVYGDPEKVPVTEDTPLKPICPYGRNKLSMELLLADSVNIGIDSVALRYFNAAGAHESGKLGENPDFLGNLIPRVFKASEGKYHLQIRGDTYETRDGTAVRDYVHVMDLAKGHVKALGWILEEEKVTEAFNLCSGTGTTVMEIVQEVKKITGRNIDYEIVDSDPSEAEKLIGSYDKAKEILDWEPKRRIKEISKDLDRWYQNN